MIGYLEGKVILKQEDRILLLANQVGYEVLLPAFVMESLGSCDPEETIGLFIYYHQTEKQPRPVLIGFFLEAEKEFFQYFISVEAIGPMKAVKALVAPVREIARAIENGDVSRLSRLKGIGNRTAQKIVASLGGKMGKFALIREEEKSSPRMVVDDVAEQVLDVMIKQLGHKPADARQMIKAAMSRKPSIGTPEELFDEVYRGETSS